MQCLSQDEWVKTVTCDFFAIVIFMRGRIPPDMQDRNVVLILSAPVSYIWRCIVTYVVGAQGKRRS